MADPVFKQMFATGLLLENTLALSLQLGVRFRIFVCFAVCLRAFLLDFIVTWSFVGLLFSTWL